MRLLQPAAVTSALSRTFLGNGLLAQYLQFGSFLVSHLIELGGRHVTLVGTPLPQKLLGNLPMPLGASELIGWLTIPIEFEPFETVEDRRDGLIGGTRPVGILDA